MGVESFLEVRTEADVRREVRSQAAAGVDAIQICPGFTPDLVRAAVEAAHASHLPVIGHLQRTSWTEAARDGIDGVEHLATRSAATDSMLLELRRHGVTVDPTLITLHSKFWGNDPIYRRPTGRDLVPDVFWRGWAAGSFTASWTGSQYAAARASWPRAEALVRRMREAGIRMVVGTDTPTPWIIPGESVVRGDPIADLRSLRRIDWVIADGIARTPGEIRSGRWADGRK